MNRIFLVFAIAVMSMPAFAQRKVRQATREGNSLYHKEDYLNAEIQYRTALDGNAADSIAMYNLGNSLFRQQQDEKAQEALRHYVNAAQAAQKGGDRKLAAKAYYNAGDVCMAATKYQEAVQFFKRALRNDPSDDEARYNLLLAQKLLEQQQNQDQDQDQDDQKDDQQQQQQQQQQQDQSKDDNNEQQDQDQNPPEQQDQQQEQQQQSQSQQMSQEQAEAILNANNRDEHETQEKVQQRQMQQMQRRKTNKDW